MERSTLTAPLRVYDTGHDRLAVYYLDIFQDQQLVGLWKRSELAQQAAQFAHANGFEAFAVQLVPIEAGATQ